MNKAVIASILAGSMWGNITAPSMMPSAIAQSLPSTQPSVATPNPIGIELLDAGAEPQRELKFIPAVNSKQTTTRQQDKTEGSWSWSRRRKRGEGQKISITLVRLRQRSPHLDKAV